MTARRREGRPARTDWRTRLRIDGFTFIEADLAFAHPRTSKRIEVRAPLPPELRDYLMLLARTAKADPASIDALLREFL
jgi:hypothetical protein